MTQLDMTQGTPGVNAPYVIEVSYDLDYEVQTGWDYYAGPADWYAEKILWDAGRLDFFVADESNLNAYLNRDPYVGYEVAEDISHNSVQFHVPSVQDYFIVFSNAEHHGLTTFARATIHLWRDESVEVPPASGLTAFMRAAPNPFTPRTTLQIGVTEAGPHAVRVYDLGGRLIRTLAEASFQPGTFNLVWDGTNDNGQPVSGGTYFVKLSWNERLMSRRVVLLR
jgi:hypothetical protein